MDEPITDRAFTGITIQGISREYDNTLGGNELRADSQGMPWGHITDVE